MVGIMSLDTMAELIGFMSYDFVEYSEYLAPIRDVLTDDIIKIAKRKGAYFNGSITENIWIRKSHGYVEHMIVDRGTHTSSFILPYCSHNYSIYNYDEQSFREVVDEAADSERILETTGCSVGPAYIHYKRVGEKQETYKYKDFIYESCNEWLKEIPDSFSYKWNKCHE